ncbi:oxidoreductase C-terminal domain-containing protein [Streptomyces decoyicus]|uniref:oxidoreductase C-terminal domain-containing protein n=1 Tax=Streptomyces decoyicus TaxID=249567 RepID=UPI0033D07E87
MARAYPEAVETAHADFAAPNGATTAHVVTQRYISVRRSYTRTGPTTPYPRAPPRRPLCSTSPPSSTTCPTFSTQHGSTLEYVGYPTGWDNVITHGEPNTPGFTAFWLNGTTPVAAITLDNWGASDRLRTLIAQARPADTRLLADSGIEAVRRAIGAENEPGADAAGTNVASC